MITICPVCFKKFSFSPSSKRIYCSVKCRTKKLPPPRQDVALWTKHLSVNKFYYEIKTPNGWILEHRYVMEQHLGRKLTKQEFVHHINGNGLDNRLKNLIILSRGNHIWYHRRLNSHK